MRGYLILLLVVQLVSGLEFERGYPRIVDGDTVVLNGKNIRLQGIDAPETRQTCTDRYEPTLSVCVWLRANTYCKPDVLYLHACII